MDKSSSKLDYVCINCGNVVGELFKEYSPSVLKMSNCDHCHCIADKYIEYDPVIVIIDLVLLNRQAYRHILYNTSFKNHWKLAIILLLVESYYNWSKLNETTSTKLIEVRDIHYDLFQGEKNFYITFGKSAFEMSVTFCTLYVITFLLWAIGPYSKPKQYAYKTIWKSLVLSNFGIFTLILHLIWGTNGTINPMMFVMSYVFLSQVQALSVVCNSSRLLTSIAASAGLAMKVFARSFISSIT